MSLPFPFGVNKLGSIFLLPLVCAQVEGYSSPVAIFVVGSYKKEHLWRLEIFRYLVVSEEKKYYRK